MTPRQKYEFELWVNGAIVADISNLAQKRSYTIKRNDSEELNFSLDLNEFEQFCLDGGTDPNAILDPYSTDVRVKRNGQYLFGVQVVDLDFNLDESGATIAVKCTGFLDLFKDRYVTVDYLATDAADIAWGLINTTQTRGGTGDDFGVDRSVVHAEQADKDRDRTYVDQNVKDGIINLTQLVDGWFDFRFTYDRKFETYQMIGNTITNFSLVWPYNIKKIRVPRSATNLYNYIIGKGSGFGEETLRSEYPDNPTAADDTSRGNRKTREKIVSFNSVSEQQTLDDNSTAELSLDKDILEIPILSVDGDDFDLNTYWIGDRIPIEIQGHTMLATAGTFRIEQLHVTLDENDAEEIDLSLDDYGLS